MRNILCSIVFFICFLVIIGLSIWLGFPPPENFDRTYICVVGFIFSVMFMVTAIICSNENIL